MYDQWIAYFAANWLPFVIMIIVLFAAVKKQSRKQDVILVQQTRIADALEAIKNHIVK